MSDPNYTPVVTADLLNAELGNLTTSSANQGDVLTYDAATGLWKSTSGVQVRTTHITSAQLLDLHNTPVELVPAPGVGKTIVVLALIGAYHDGGTPYSSTEGAQMAAGTLPNPLIDTWMPPSYFPLSNNMSSPGDATILASGGVNSLYAPDLSLVAQSNGALTDGDGTLDVTVMYVVVG